MTAPDVWAQRFAISCLVGAQLGILYGFLRPLRPRHRTVSDLLFLPGLLAAFLYTGFSLCGGDLRLGCMAGLAAGGVLWELTVGRCLRPIFSVFWKGIRGISHFLLIPLKKISEKAYKKGAVAEPILQQPTFESRNH